MKGTLMRGFATRLITIALLACLILATCTSQQPPNRSADQTPAAPAILDEPLYPFTLDYLGRDSPEVTRSFSVNDKALLEILATPLAADIIPGITLVANPANSRLSLRGPLIPVTALTELLTDLDRGQPRVAHRSPQSRPSVRHSPCPQWSVSSR
jgi:hypothetical protein